MDSQHKLDQAVETLHLALDNYPPDAKIEAATVIASVRIPGRPEPSVVVGMDSGNEPIPEINQPTVELIWG